MPIPYNTTTVTIERRTEAAGDLEPYGDYEEGWQVSDTGVRASIGVFSRTVSATEVRRGGEISTMVLQLTCDIPPNGLTHQDRVTDDTTGEVYNVHWAFKRIGLGLDHMTCEIGQWKGLVG
jgi:hypothetical protein